MKLKHLAIAALAVSAMGSAMAQGVTSSASTATLLIAIGDGSHSYTFDTGVSLASIENGTANYSAILPNWASFNFGATTPFDPASQTGVEWGALGATATPANQISFASLMISGTQDALNDGTLSTQYKNLGLKNDSQRMLSLAGGPTSPLEAASGTSVNAGTPAYLSTGYFNLGYGAGNQAQALSAGVDTLGLYLITPTGSNNNTFATLTQETSLVTLNTSTGQLTISAAAAVPEPSSYALAIAGLAWVCFIVRRRRA